MFRALPGRRFGTSDGALHAAGKRLIRADNMNTVPSLKIVKSKVAPLVEAALAESGGLLRLAPCWVPRSFLQPGKRLKLHPEDLYAYGLNRGGIDERWFASTTPCPRSEERRVGKEGRSRWSPY